MRPIFRRAAVSALAVLSAAVIAAPAAWAQDAQRPNADQMHARMQQMREAHERQRAADMRTILRLRPDQEAALTAFMQSHDRRGKGGGSAERRGPPGDGAMAMTTPQRLDEMARRDSERDAMKKRHAEALRTFYAALSPDQRQVFDALQRMHGGGRGGWGGGHSGGGMHGPMGGHGGPGGPPPPRDE